MKNIKINHTFTLKKMLQSILDIGHKAFMNAGMNSNFDKAKANAMEEKINEYLDMIK